MTGCEDGLPCFILWEQSVQNRTLLAERLFYEQLLILSSFPPDAHVTESDVHRGNVNTYTVVVSGKLLPGIGKFIKVAMEAE